MRKPTYFKSFIFLFICAIGYVFASLWLSTNHLVIRDYDFSSDKVTSDVRMVVLADLHDHQFGEGNGELVQAIMEQKPDLVLMVGDMLNNISSDSRVPCELVCALSELVPVYFALGNHEEDYMEKNGEELLEELEEAGAIVLEKEFVDLEVKGTKLRLGGMYDYAFGMDGRDTASKAPEEVRRFLTEFQDTDRLRIMMSHRPDSFIFGDASEYWGVDLVVSGHVHGGQVVLPFVGGVWGMDQGWFPEYDQGMFEKGKMSFFVTSGLGSAEEKVPRFNNPPEIAVVNLRKS